MRRVLIRTSGLLGVVTLLHNHPLSAQERFDISVYPYATAHRGEWELEGHLNYTSRGTSGFAGSVAPTQGQWRFAAEVSRGITDHWELAGYLLGAQIPGMGFEYAGWRLRSRLRAPESWRLPVNVGFSAEYETARPAFGETSQHHQCYPTADWRLGDDMTLHLGVGFGGVTAGDRLVFKTRFEMPLSSEK